jgi:hypothetical protein
VIALLVALVLWVLIAVGAVLIVGRMAARRDRDEVPQRKHHQAARSRD